MARITRTNVGKSQITSKTAATGTSKRAGIMPAKAKPGKKPTGTSGGSGSSTTSK